MGKPAVAGFPFVASTRAGAALWAMQHAVVQ